MKTNSTLMKPAIILIAFAVSFCMVATLYSDDVHAAKAKTYKTKNFKYQIKNNKVYITGNRGKAKKITIPKTIQKKKVVSAKITIKKSNTVITKKAKYLKSLTIKGTGKGSFKNLNLTKNTNLKSLSIKKIKGLKKLDLTKNSQLQTLSITSSIISTVDVRNSKALYFIATNKNSIDYLYAGNNSFDVLFIRGFKNIDMGTNAQLDELHVDSSASDKAAGKGTSTLNISGCPNMTLLEVYNSNLKNIDLNNNKKLVEAEFINNELASIDVSQNTDLIQLNLDNNKLSALDVSKNTELETLYCRNNKIDSLDLTNSGYLLYLHCNNNKLTSLDVNGLLRLREMYFQYNPGLSVDISTNSALDQIGYTPGNTDSKDPDGTMVKIKIGSPITSYTNGTARYIGS